jgi:type VI secretion system protein ImpA
LKKAASKLSNALGDPEVGEETDDDAADEGSGGGAPVRGGGGGGGGGITSPTDVQNALDRIVAYYERYEPSSPLPLLLLRAKRLVNADFLTIVKDMAPHGIDNVNLIGGLEDKD